MGRILAIVAVALLAMPATASAQATREVEVISFNGSFEVNDLCSFPLIEHQEGTFQIATFFDASGTPTKQIITVRSPYVVTLSAHGKTLTGVSPFAEKIVLDAEGELVTATLVGLVSQFRVPGDGVLLIDTGRIVFDADFDIIFEAGPHPVAHGDTAALCDYFS